VLGGKLDQVRFDEAVDEFTAFRIERHPMTGLLGHILDLRDNFTVYDAAYLVLAQALEAPIVSRREAEGNTARHRRAGLLTHQRAIPASGVSPCYSGSGAGRVAVPVVADSWVARAVDRLVQASAGVTAGRPSVVMAVRRSARPARTLSR
jgi:hypothetical protein